MVEGLFFGRFYSFNLFGFLESDEDFGIEGVLSLRSYSIVMDLDEGEIRDKEFFFNWLYYSGEEELLLIGIIQYFLFDFNDEDEMEVGVISDIYFDRGVSNYSIVEGSDIEYFQIDYEFIEIVGEDEFFLMGIENSIEQYVFIFLFCVLSKFIVFFGNYE